MAIQMKFKPIADAIIKNVELKDPEETVFVVGRTIYTAKTLLIHFKKEDAIAKELIQVAIRIHTGHAKSIVLKPNDVTPEVIEKTAKMFEV